MNDVIRFDCSACGARMKVKAGAKGKRTKCPKCGNPERVPEAQLPAVVDKPRLPAKTKPAPVAEVADDVFAADMIEPPTKEQTITIRETQIVTRDPSLPAISVTALPAPIEPTPVPQPPTVACRFCGEQILATAIKCKHCSEFLDGRQWATPQQHPQMMPQITINTNSNNKTEAPKPERMNTEDNTGLAAFVVFVMFVLFPLFLAVLAIAGRQ